ADEEVRGQADPASSIYYLRFLPTSAASGGETEKLIGVGDHSVIAEAYRVLRTSLLLSTAGQPPKMILFTSGMPGEGKTTTVINSAISLSQLGSSVLIIDADLRKPMTHRGFGLSSEQGLSTYLSSEVE